MQLDVYPQERGKLKRRIVKESPTKEGNLVVRETERKGTKFEFNF